MRVTTLVFAATLAATATCGRAHEYAVQTAKAGQACDLSGALKTAAEEAVEHASRSHALALAAEARVSALMRWNFAQRGTDGNGATGEVAQAKAHIEATLKQAQSKATEARSKAEKTLNAAVTLARKARVQAGKIDGMVDMLATWNSGRQTESNGAAMCLADTVGSVQKWTGRNSATGKRDTAAGLLKACGYDWAPGKEQPQENKDLAEAAATVVADLASTGTSGRTAVPNTVQSTADDTCPLFYGPTAGYGIWLDAANKPYVRLGGLWALKGTATGLKISLEGKAGRDTMRVPATDEPVSNNAAAHPVIAKLIEEQKAVKEALAGRQGVDAKVAECHRLLDTTRQTRALRAQREKMSRHGWHGSAQTRDPGPTQK
ncbi:hypothetical protein, conserved in T. vivax [Trypanosoma vivax Y486]|uniref:Trypanosome variant surface glycoprotein A-type N-terminal domain-containing protein n=1 Tax=Trypanosoma vivax (strain Y486) TaxID=1055687 RepID=F9WPS9_TRYVY|nr:hypothetical protein, conserved in T. vivax [Trypanosoma vivax Y486]|eukprot:CCD19556.1 hypothetical protein, conserved in T. vivax [Trypanosoma vivax Y486]